MTHRLAAGCFSALHFAALLTERFGLTPEEVAILESQVMALDRRHRRAYHRRLEPRLGEFARFFAQELCRRSEHDPATADQWATQVGFSIAQRGFASIAEQIVIEAVGRQAVSQVIRAAKEGCQGGATI